MLFGQNIAKENSHCCVRVHTVKEVHKHVPWGYLLSVISVVHSELAAYIFVSTFLRKYVIEVQFVVEQIGLRL